MSTRIEVSGLTTCPWLVERRKVVTAEMAEAGWYPDFPSDLIETVECGAPVTDIVDGWECEAGHRHLSYGSPSQIAEEQEEAFAERFRR